MVMDGVTELRVFFRKLWTCCLVETVLLDTLPEERVVFSSWIAPNSIFSSAEEFAGPSPEGLENNRKAAPATKKNMISKKIMFIDFF